MVHSDALASWRPTDTSGLHSYFYYDGRGLAAAVDERGFLSETVSNEQLNTLSSKQYLTAVTVGAGDTLATLKSRAGSFATTAQIEYDGFGRVLKVTGGDGSTVTRNEYDAAGRLVRMISADATTAQRASRTRYNACGEVTGTLGGVGEPTLGASPTQTEIALQSPRTACAMTTTASVARCARSMPTATRRCTTTTARTA